MFLGNRKSNKLGIYYPSIFSYLLNCRKSLISFSMFTTLFVSFSVSLILSLFVFYYYYHVSFIWQLHFIILHSTLFQYFYLYVFTFWSFIFIIILRSGWSAGKLWMCSEWISAGKPAAVTKVIRGFTISRQKSEMGLQLSLACYISSTFQFITHPSTYHWKLYSLRYWMDCKRLKKYLFA
jgi:hypothetical protein